MNQYDNTTHIYEFFKVLEKTLIVIIHDSVEQMTISVEDAGTMARDFLQLFPIRSNRDVCDKLYAYSQKYPVTLSLFLAYAKSYESTMSMKKATILHSLLEEKKIDKAFYLTKGGIL